MKTQNVLIVGGLSALLYFFTATRQGSQAVALASGALSGYGTDGGLSQMEVTGLAENMVAANFPQLDPRMLVAIAWIESRWRPTAWRLEVNVGDASVGLMQTLGNTAGWLWDIGNREMGPRPSLDDLTDPSLSMYYGAAYLNWLRTYAGSERAEEWIVRGYNGGPGGAEKSYTQDYWNKYSAARAQFG